MSQLLNTDLTEFLLEHVRPRPAMYLMDNKLISLNKFIMGYRIATQINGFYQTDRFLEFFSDWFLNATNNRPGSMWYPLILEECNGSEEEALKKFWKYLELFSSRHTKK